MTVEVVIINWRRPANVTKILDALKAQSHPCTITVCDCAEQGFHLPPETLVKIDNRYCFGNHGAFNRYIPAFNYSHDYTLFLDDDLLPGPRVIEHFVRWSQQKPDALLGHYGRGIPSHYNCNVPPRGSEFKKVDLLIRAYWVKTSFLPSILQFKQQVGKSIRHDDMMLAWASHTYSKAGVWLTPKGSQDEGFLDLPEPHSLCQQPDHYQSRDTTWQGFKKLSQEIQAHAPQSPAQSTQPACS